MCPPLQSSGREGGEDQFPLSLVLSLASTAVAATLVLQTDGSYRQNELFWIDWK